MLADRGRKSPSYDIPPVAVVGRADLGMMAHQMKIRGLWAVMMCFKMVLRQSDKVNLWWPEICPFRNISVRLGCARGKLWCE